MCELPDGVCSVFLPETRAWRDDLSNLASRMLVAGQSSSGEIAYGALASEPARRPDRNHPLQGPSRQPAKHIERNSAEFPARVGRRPQIRNLRATAPVIPLAHIALTHAALRYGMTNHRSRLVPQLLAPSQKSVCKLDLLTAL